MARIHATVIFVLAALAMMIVPSNVLAAPDDTHLIGTEEPVANAFLHMQTKAIAAAPAFFPLLPLAESLVPLLEMEHRHQFMNLFKSLSVAGNVKSKALSAGSQNNPWSAPVNPMCATHDETVSFSETDFFLNIENLVTSPRSDEVLKLCPYRSVNRA